jgi:glycosyltransferase involved in cell wall biosynthesis
MRIALVQNMVYLPTLGGANKANRRLVEVLARRGHDCFVVAPATGRKAAIHDREGFLRELGERGIPLLECAANRDVFRCAGVEVHAVTRPGDLRPTVVERLSALRPDWVLVTSEDPEQSMLEAALEGRPGRVVYLVHTPLMLPFGPNSFAASASGTRLFQRAAGVVTVSRCVRDYVRRWSGMESPVLRFPVYGDGPFLRRGDPDEGYAVLVNPCAYKGIPLFLALARRLPDVAFAAVPTWGTTAADRAALAAEPNVHLLPPADDIDEVFARTRVLLMPSLWMEAFPLLPIEAMLRGVPVIASDAGGLPEAMLGVDHVLPVRPIERYEQRLDERGNPVPVVPEQDLDPWEETLRGLLDDRGRYERLSAESYRVAGEFVSGVGGGPF